MLQEIVCTSGYGPQWHNEIDCSLNAREPACMYECEFQVIFYTFFNLYLYQIHACLWFVQYEIAFGNNRPFSMQMCGRSHFYWVELGTDGSDVISSICY